MAVIVRHKGNRQVYLLVGTSYSYYKDSRPSFLGGDLFPHEEEGLFDFAAVTDENGKIVWYPTEEIQVLEVDGKNIKDILGNFKAQDIDLPEGDDEAENFENCPGCGCKVRADEVECPSCGLALILE